MPGSRDSCASLYHSYGHWPGPELRSPGRERPNLAVGETGKGVALETDSQGWTYLAWVHYLVAGV